MGTFTLDIYGLSDAVVSAQWDLYGVLIGKETEQSKQMGAQMSTKYILWAIGGARLGIADADKKDPYGNYIPARYQLGTGTTDPILGIRFQANRPGGISPGFTTIYIFNSENKIGYERSDSVYIKAEVSFMVSSKFLLIPAISSIISPTHDRLNGVIQENTRGENYYIEGDLYWMIKPTLMPFISIKWLFYTSDMEAENTIKLTALVGLMIRF
ncbi:MAG: hypothetical protein N2234_02975 [Planctomycetota bacterium]|nr:hypothetical protein [Planctomycetota bacterium]